VKPIGGPQITIARKSGSAALMKRVLGTTRMAAYVGVPAASTNARSEQLLAMAGKTSNKKKQARLRKAATKDITNAELLFIHTKGSPIRHIDARPVVEPAIAAQGNREPIARELADSVKASLGGDRALALKKMHRAAMAGQNAARGWFTDPRNGWKPNAKSTIERKGSSRPLIDIGALRAAIVGVVGEE
jgi:hypothetical protein